jgi:AhpD family alkylhydroperoxidase
MSEFPVHTQESAPEAARPLLEGAARQMGFVPNLLAVMAGAPPLLEAYMTLTQLLEKTSLAPAERQLVLLTVSRTNDCHYCIPAHTFLAEKAGRSATPGSRRCAG